MCIVYGIGKRKIFLILLYTFLILLKVLHNQILTAFPKESLNNCSSHRNIFSIQGWGGDTRLKKR